MKNEELISLRGGYGGSAGYDDPTGYYCDVFHTDDSGNWITTTIVSELRCGCEEAFTAQFPGVQYSMAPCGYAKF